MSEQTINQSWCCCDVMPIRECPIHGEFPVFILTAAESAPGMPTIIRADTGRSILATVDRTPVFATLDVAERVLAMLNDHRASFRVEVEALAERWDKDPARHFAAKELRALLPTPPVDHASEGLSEAEREALWTTIATVRDGAPRTPDDADTNDIIDAIIDSGLFHRIGSAAATRARAEGAAEALREAADDARKVYIECESTYRGSCRPYDQGVADAWDAAADGLRDRADSIARSDAAPHTGAQS